LALTGTLINAAAVVLAGTGGALLGDRLPERIRQTVIAGIGLTTLLIGAQMALKTQHLLIVLGSVVLGGIVGELLDLDAALERLGRWLEARVTRLGLAGSGKPSFTRAFVTASLVFCVGPMTIVGSLQDGLTGDYQTLAVKSMLDGFAGLAFASSLGIGVAFSALTVLVYQGLLTLGASWVKGLLSEAMVTEMTATGGLLILGIGFQLLEIRRIRVANLLPAVVLAPVAVALVGAWL
jgi:uncharacterized membrane protein YqgA involved in biofilm formation